MPIHVLHAASVPKGQRPWLLACIMAALTFAVQRLVLNLGATGSNLDFDQNQFHIPVIRRFALEWPSPDFSDYFVATAPGFHVVMSWLVKLFGFEILEEPVMFLRLLSGLFCVGLVGYITLHAVRRSGHPIGLTLGALVLLNPYVIIIGTRIAPESISWLMIAMGLGFAVGPRPWMRVLTTGSLLTIGAVLTRQNNLWIASLVWIAAWMGSPSLQPSFQSAAKFPGRGLIPPPDEFKIHARVRRLIPAMLATLPAFGVVALFFSLWGGLVPPTFQAGSARVFEGATQHTGGNAAAPATILALFGAYAPLMLPLMFEEIRDVWKKLRPGAWLIALGAVLGFIAAVAVESSYSHAEGRWGSYWSIIRVLPAPFERSIVIVPLATIGGAAVAAVLAGSQPRTRWVLLVALAGFIASSAANSRVWIRYFDPFVVLWLVLAIADVYLVRGQRPNLRESWIKLIGPWLLAVFFAALAAHRLFGT